MVVYQTWCRYDSSKDGIKSKGVAGKSVLHAWRMPQGCSLFFIKNEKRQRKGGREVREEEGKEKRGEEER